VLFFPGNYVYIFKPEAIINPIIWSMLFLIYSYLSRVLRKVLTPKGHVSFDMKSAMYFEYGVFAYQIH
jgi:hypothetical protein